MKKKLFLILFLITSINFAQSGFTNYKAVITDQGAPLTNHPIQVRFTVLHGGTQVFQEIQNTTTDAHGIFSVNIGSENATDWFAINWAELGFNLKTEIDSGNGFVDFGTQAFRFVPYAQHSVSAFSADVAYEVDFNNITNVPAGLADGDDVNDADHDATNEIQTLTLSATQLSISNGNTVNFSNWDTDTSDDVQQLNDLSDAKTYQSSIFIGNTAGSQNSGNSASVGIGFNSLKNSTSSYNTAIGAHTLEDNTNGSSNTAVGSYTLYKNIDGNYNTAIGYKSMNNSTTAVQNTAIGSKTLYNIISGMDNVVVGNSAAGSLQSGSGNTIIGAKAGYQNTGNRNIFIGNRAGYNETGSDKLYIDNSSTNTPLIYGDFLSNMIKINGSLTINDGTQGAGKVLLSDANGNASWSDIPVQTKVLNIKPSLFVPQNGSNLIHQINRSFISSSNGTVSQYMLLPINLPVGANITNIKVYYVDNSTTANLKCQIVKVQVNSAYNLVIGTAQTSSGNSSNGQTFEFTSNLNLSSSYTYAIQILNTGAAWGTDTSPKMFIYGVKITYEE